MWWLLGRNFDDKFTALLTNGQTDRQMPTDERDDNHKHEFQNG